MHKIDQPLILIVDDSIIDLQIVGQFLEKNNYNTIQAISGSDALEKLRTHVPDMILLDVEMPDMSGYQVCLKIKSQQKLKHIPVMMITSLDDKTSIDNSFAAGADDYALKPIHYNLLLKRLQTILTKNRYMKELKIEQESDAHQAKILIDSTADGIFGLDRDGKCTWANESCLHMIGYNDVTELVGQNMHELIHHSHSDDSPYIALECHICETINQGISVHISDEVWWKRDGTKLPVEYRSNPIYRDNSIAGAVVTFVDITERLKLVDLQKQQEKQAMLTHASRLATLGEMATGIAHEMNQPLAGIAYTNAFLKKASELNKLSDEDFADSLNDIDDCIKRMSRIINHIRTFARQDGICTELCDIHETIGGALMLLGEQLRIHQITVIEDYDRSLPTIECCPSQLEQVWINHITNSRDSLDEKEGKIGELHKTLTIATQYNQAEQAADILFTDNGAGMTEEVKNKIFDPFYTTKEVGKGTGLGLSVSHGIIANHNGKYAVDSRDGEGTTIRITLPIKISKE